jgi:hypothetical protein
MWHSEVAYSAANAAKILSVKRIFIFDRSGRIDSICKNLQSRSGHELVPIRVLNVSDIFRLLVAPNSPPHRNVVLFVTPEVCTTRTQALAVQASADSEVSRIFWMCHNLVACMQCLKRTLANVGKVTVLASSEKMRHSVLELLPSVDCLHFVPLLTNFAKRGKDRPLQFSGNPRRALQVLIPGSVNFSKRNYEALIPVSGTRNCPRNVQFQVFGKCLATSECSRLEHISARLKLYSIGMSHSSHFVSGNFASYSALDAAVRRADIIAPFIDNSVEMYSQYLDGKLSASVILAISYNRPLLIWSELSLAYGFSKQVVYSSPSSLWDTLCSLDQPLLSGALNEINLASRRVWDKALDAMKVRL